MSAPKPIRFRVGMGCLGFFFSVFPGTVFFLLFMGLRGQVWPVVIAGSICIPLLLVFLFGRKGVMLDVANRRIVRWWGLWFPGVELRFASKSEPLVSTETILDHVWKTTKNSAYKVFTVSLGPVVVPLAEFPNYLRARAAAEQVGNALGLPVRDATPGEGRTRREAGTLDLPLRDRLRQSSALPAKPAPPERTSLAREAGDGEVFFEMPKDVPKAMKKMRIVLSILGLLATILVAELAVEPVIAAPLGWSVAVTLAALAMVGLSTVAGATERVRLYVSSREIRRESQSWVHQTSSRIDAARIEEVTVGTTRVGKHETVVAAWGDQDILEFGAGLPATDLEWIRKEILHRLGS